jgi:hypothetical protein
MPEPKKAKSSPEFPPLFQAGTFRMTPEQHLAAAAQLRRRGGRGTVRRPSWRCTTSSWRR